MSCLPRFITPLPPGAAESARLSGIQLLEPIAEATEKLLTRLNAVGGKLVLRRYQVPASDLERHNQPAGFNLLALTRHLCELKRHIAKACGMPSDNVLLHREARSENGYYFLAPPDCGIGIAVERAAVTDPQCLFELVLESLLLKADGPLAHRLSTAVGPRGRAARLYLLVHSYFTATHRNHCLECLGVDLQIDRYGQLMVDTKIRVFAIPETAAGQYSTLVPTQLETGVVRLALIDEARSLRLDGRKAKGIREITYQLRHIESCRWYVLNQVLGMVRDTLVIADIAFEFQNFTATHFVKEGYLKSSNLDRLSCLVLVVPDMLMQEIATRTTLTTLICEELGLTEESAVAWQPWSQFAPQALLPADVPYLFINQAVGPWEFEEKEEESSSLGPEWREEDTERSSCTLLGKPCEPDEAFLRIAQNPTLLAAADPYTQVKYVNLIAADRPRACFQGLDVQDALSELLSIKEAMDKAPRRVQLNNKLKKALSELLLKQALVRGRFSVAKPLPPICLRAYLSRASRKQKGNNLEMVSRINFTVQPDGTTVLLSASRVPPFAKAQLLQVLQEMPLLRKGQDAAAPGALPSLALRDATFVLELIDDADTDSVCLVIYDGSTVAIPRIIGNMKHRLLHEQLSQLRSVLPIQQKTLSRGMEDNVLPYYIKGFEGQRGKDRGDHLFIEAKTDRFLRYFVPQPSAPKQNGRFSRPYDLMLYLKSDVQRNHPLPITVDHPLVQIYFAMMTQDMILLGQNSKNTLLRKLAGLTLLN
ncbi:MAG: hypothetical protein ABS69_03855 [Nitrosomonadales bacterium SCN 54-20]|nr:MAG: hypothetical protein ABS69_03855 [Nitrosomonadales bacterium SCN 54-20]